MFAVPERNKYYKGMKKDFKCETLWSSSVIDESSNHCLPPKKIPKKQIFDFTYGGRVDLKDFYSQDVKFGASWQVKSSVKRMFAQRAGKLLKFNFCSDESFLKF